jgi:fatty acid desaturase
MKRRIDLSRFKKRSDLRSLLTVAAHLILVLTPVYLAAFLGPSVYWLDLWLWFGLLMNGLLNLMHECAHYHVFRRRGGSDFLGRWVLGPLAFANFDSYRWRHWEHHIHLGVDGDTKDAYLVDISGPKLIGFVLRCLTLSEALRKFRHQTTGSGGEPVRAIVWLRRAALTHAVFFGSLLLVAGPAAHRPWSQAFAFAALAYALIYGYGLASLTVFAATLRAIAEHKLETGQSSSTGRAALRNFKCGPVSRLVFGAYGFAEHGTHHFQPALPYYHLGPATEELAIHDPEFIPNHRYVEELVTLSKPLSSPCPDASVART